MENKNVKNTIISLCCRSSDCKFQEGTGEIHDFDKNFTEVICEIDVL